MDMMQLDELIHVVAGYFTGPDMPLNTNALHVNKGGRYQLRERADRFFQVREQLGLTGFSTAEHAETTIRRKLGLPLTP